MKISSIAKSEVHVFTFLQLNVTIFSLSLSATLISLVEEFGAKKEAQMYYYSIKCLHVCF